METFVTNLKDNMDDLVNKYNNISEEITSFMKLKESFIKNVIKIVSHIKSNTLNDEEKDILMKIYDAMKRNVDGLNFNCNMFLKTFLPCSSTITFSTRVYNTFRNCHHVLLKTFLS